MPRTTRLYGPPPKTGRHVLITDNMVNEIRKIKTGTAADAAKKYKVSEMTISKIWLNQGRFARIPLK